MKRLKLLIWFIFLALSIPVGYFIVQTYGGLKAEETARLRFFAETIFDEIENELAGIVTKEENRHVDAYNAVYLAEENGGTSSTALPSPLAQKPEETYILGYLQNNPDGSFHTPLVPEGRPVAPGLQHLVDALQSVNAAFNARRAASNETAKRPREKTADKKAFKKTPGLEEPYLDRSRKKAFASAPQQQSSRVEEITAGQAMRLSQKSPSRLQSDNLQAAGEIEGEKKRQGGEEAGAPGEAVMADSEAPAPEADGIAGRTFQIEIAPLQSVIISDDRVFMFRRVVIGDKIYRQGFVIELKALAAHLAATHFNGQPIAGYSRLSIDVAGRDGTVGIARFGDNVRETAFSLRRTFPFPFDFLSAGLDFRLIPHTANRRTLNLMMSVFVAVFVLGFLAIYHSARTVIDLAERRSRFVSSVTHELKTPLTNIRMYIELLEQGIAGSPEREQEYFGVLNAESVRLARLINNVLELSKLENRQRRINLVEGNLDEVFTELETVMGKKVRQAGFTLTIDRTRLRPFFYDAEIMMLILTNLIENSLKFGASEPVKSITVKTRQEGSLTEVAVADTGPGIPRHALKKVFRDFYRVEGALTRRTGGTGIGLALVKKFARLMHGTVTARNNDGPGCTITLSMPESDQSR